MRTIRLYIETGCNSSDRMVDFEVEDDTPYDQIGREAEELFFNYVNYSWYEIDSES